jgi:hypothetical protein
MNVISIHKKINKDLVRKGKEPRKYNLILNEQQAWEKKMSEKKLKIGEKK